jgi:twitching motility two-component system response regulator PilH
LFVRQNRRQILITGRFVCLLCLEEFIVGLLDQFRSIFGRSSRIEADKEEDGSNDRRVRPRKNPREGTRVLIVDDSHTIVEILKRFLVSIGCVTLEASDAKAGLELALTQKPELIFLDIVMPGINGFAALRALRKNSRTKAIPVIMMSGNEQATAQFFGSNIGADDFMKKPFSRSEVFVRIERLLDENHIPCRLPVVEQPAIHPVDVGQVPQTSHINLSAYTANPPQQQPLTPAAAPTTAAEPPAPPVLVQPLYIPDVLPVTPVQQQTVPPRQERASLPEQAEQPASQATPPVAPTQAELLAQLANLAQLAQTDPSALTALTALTAQLVAQSAPPSSPSPAADRQLRAS